MAKKDFLLNLVGFYESKARIKHLSQFPAEVALSPEAGWTVEGVHRCCRCGLIDDTGLHVGLRFRVYSVGFRSYIGVMQGLYRGYIGTLG